MKSLLKVFRVVSVGLVALVPAAAGAAEVGISRVADGRDSAGYATAGGVQVGVSAGVQIGGEEAAATFKPSVGYFVTDNLQLSAILGYARGSSLGIYSALFEPSIHLPISTAVFGFAGVGAGVNHVSSHGTGFLLAPRVGASFLVGRKGVLSPSLVLSTASNDIVSVQVPGQPMGETTRMSLATSYGLNLGYSVMW
jgi:hypothetical protein